MKILCVGGAGFLGAWIARRLLAGGHEVVVFDRSEDRALLDGIVGPNAKAIAWRRGDVTSQADLEAAGAGCGAIVHLAALLTPACRTDPVYGASVNLIGTINIFETARKLGIGMVAYASSAGVFGPDNGVVPYPMTLYGTFKLACEGVARAYAEDYGQASVGFRPLTIYGPGREHGASAGPSIACRKAAASEPYAIPFTGMTDLIFVDDVAAAFEAAVTRKVVGAHVFNLRGVVARLDDVAAGIRAAVPGAQVSCAGAPMPISAELEAHDVEPVLGSLPSTSLAEGLRRTVDFYRSGRPGNA